MYEKIREALQTAAVVCGAGGVLFMLCPGGRDGGMRKQVSLLLSLLLCLGLLLPLREVDFGAMAEMLSVPETGNTGEEDAREAVLRLTEENLEEQLAGVLREKYRIVNPVLKITFERETEGAVTVAGVTLRGEGDLSAGAAYLEQILGCAVDTEEI